MSYDPAVAQAARAAARELAPQLGVEVEADVEAVLNGDADGEPPTQFVDPISAAILIVALAQLGYQIYSDRKKKGEKPTKDALAAGIRNERREEVDPTEAEKKIIEIVSAEIVERSGLQA
jgi:hypothetical protein